MGKIAFVFPGQGAQYAGMARELYEISAAVKSFLDMAERIRRGTLDQMFYGDEEELKLTANTQPCMFCADMASAIALEEAGVKADILAGFSLGEIAALAFSGAVSYEEGFKLVMQRGELMQKASEGIDAGMVAVLKLGDEEVVSACAGFDNVYAVNFNCDGQVVVSGDKEKLEPFKARIKELGGRVMPLKVGGAFHSPYMRSASEKFARILAVTEISEPQKTMFSNLTGKPYSGDIKTLLAKQLMNPVLWKKSVEAMLEMGADTFIEVGPGKVLSGLIARISPEARVLNVENIESLKKTISEVGSRA